MDIYRIEGINDPETGPWNTQRPEDTDPIAILFGGGHGPDDVAPAIRADIVAKATGHTLPSSLPGPQRDGIYSSRFEMIVNDDVRNFHAGFASLEQYDEWFETVSIRRALYMYKDVHLVHYVVSKGHVKIGGHQVMFDMRYAKRKEILSDERAIEG